MIVKRIEMNEDGFTYGMSSSLAAVRMRLAMLQDELFEEDNNS